ncbi:MAG: transposase [Anaerolineae bacterium]|nr:transposase [Anaerolineae bacterium]
MVSWWYVRCDANLDIISQPPTQQGFQALPCHWVVERSSDWFGPSRRLSKDYEESVHSSEDMIWLASKYHLLKALSS